MARAPSGLTLRQEKFVDALTDPQSAAYCNPSAAYRAISPQITADSSWHGASRMSRSVQVQERIQGQLGLPELGRGLKSCLRTAKRHMADPKPQVALSATAETRNTLMDYAKLTGQLVEQRRSTDDISDEDRRAIKQLIVVLMPQLAAAPVAAVGSATSVHALAVPAGDVPATVTESMHPSAASVSVQRVVSEYNARAHEQEAGGA